MKNWINLLFQQPQLRGGNDTLPLAPSNLEGENDTLPLSPSNLEGENGTLPLAPSNLEGEMITTANGEWMCKIQNEAIILKF